MTGELEDAKRTTGPNAPSGHYRQRRPHSADSDGRVRRDSIEATGQAQERLGRGEGTRGGNDGSAAQRDWPQGCNGEVGVMVVRTYDAANYLCGKSGWKISNLQLQKILYMADMNFVGKGNGRLVDEDFEAWDYGPVLPSLYHKCKAFGSKPVPYVFWGAKDISGTPESRILDLAWENLKSVTPGQLVETTHSVKGAWARRYAVGSRQIKIQTQDMIDEYERRTSQIEKAA